MVKEDGKMYCDSCEEMIKEEEDAIFVDSEEDGGEFCCWGCVVEWASEYVKEE